MWPGLPVPTRPGKTLGQRQSKMRSEAEGRRCRQKPLQGSRVALEESGIPATAGGL